MTGSRISLPKGDNMAFGLRIRKMPKAEIEKQISEVAEILELTEYLHRNVVWSGHNCILEPSCKVCA